MVEGRGGGPGPPPPPPPLRVHDLADRAAPL
jgi:hypothetical protein